MGFKRIAIFALVISICLIFLIKKIKKIRSYRFFILLCSMPCIIGSFVLVYIIKFEKLSMITESLLLETNGRNFIWSLFCNEISFLPVPFGYGLGYTDRKLELLGLPQLHNDILRIFIGVGVLIFILFFWKLFYINSCLLYTSKQHVFGAFLFYIQF